MEIEMALKIGNRNQYSFLPPVIDKYVGEDDPVRVYDAFVETLDFEKIGIDINNNKVGNSSYDPKAMMKLLVYGYSLYLGCGSFKPCALFGHYRLGI